MPSILPSPRAGDQPFLPAASLAPQAAVPQARPLPAPPVADKTHATTGDYIAVGVGIAGVAILGFAAAGGAAATEGLALGAGTLMKNAATAAKAYGPQLAEDWKAGAAALKDAAGVGKFAAKQTTAAASDFARTAVVGGGLSAGAALSRHVVHALTPAAARAPQTMATATTQCRRTP